MSSDRNPDRNAAWDEQERRLRGNYLQARLAHEAAQAAWEPTGGSGDAAGKSLAAGLAHQRAAQAYNSFLAIDRQAEAAATAAAEELARLRTRQTRVAEPPAPELERLILRQQQDLGLHRATAQAFAEFEQTRRLKEVPVPVVRGDGRIHDADGRSRWDTTTPSGQLGEFRDAFQASIAALASLVHRHTQLTQEQRHQLCIATTEAVAGAVLTPVYPRIQMPPLGRILVEEGRDSLIPRRAVDATCQRLAPTPQEQQEMRLEIWRYGAAAQGAAVAQAPELEGELESSAAAGEPDRTEAGRRPEQQDSAFTAAPLPRGETPRERFG